MACRWQVNSDYSTNKIKFIKNNEKFNYQAQPDSDFKKKLDLYFR